MIEITTHQISKRIERERISDFNRLAYRDEWPTTSHPKNKGCRNGAGSISATLAFTNRKDWEK